MNEDKNKKGCTTIIVVLVLALTVLIIANIYLDGFTENMIHDIGGGVIGLLIVLLVVVIYRGQGKISKRE